MWASAATEAPDAACLNDLSSVQYQRCLNHVQVHATQNPCVKKWLERGAGVRDLRDREGGRYVWYGQGMLQRRWRWACV